MAEEGKKSERDAFAWWSLIAGVLATASDLLTPLGPFALWLLAAFGAAAVLLFLVSLLPLGFKRGAGRLAGFAAVGAVVFGVVVGLQFATRDAEAPDKGFIATIAPPVAQIQSEVLQKPAPQQAEQGQQPATVVIQPPVPAPAPVQAPAPTPDSIALETALSSQDPAARVAAARTALASQDAAVRAAAIERLYATGDAALRQQVVLAIFAARQGGPSFPIVVVDSPENDPRQVENSTGKALSMRRVDLETGAVSGSAYSTTFSGTVGRTGINLRVGVRGSIVLTPEDNFVLRGTASSTTNGTARIEVMLQ